MKKKNVRSMLWTGKELVGAVAHTKAHARKNSLAVGSISKVSTVGKSGKEKCFN